MAELDQQQWKNVEAEIFAGNKIAAIKLYREATGVGLAEAKQTVEKIESDLRKACPEQFRAPGAKKGCGVAAMALAVTIGAMVIWAISQATG